MYGHIAPNSIVGQLFESIPPEEQYHPDFINAIMPLPEDVTTGWRLNISDSGEEWLEPETPEPSPQEARIAELEETVSKLIADMDLMLRR